MNRPDLHLHSNFSDGVLSPELLMHEAGLAGITLAAITDHDSFAGSDALQALDQPIETIPGVELSISDMPGLHLLGYGLTEGRELRGAVADLAEKRVARAREMLRLLREQGIRLDWQVLARKYRGTVGRPHIARALVHDGHVGSMQEAFDRYLGHGKPAYVAGERLAMRDALALMRRSGFVPVLAHPYELGKDDVTLLALLRSWQEQGLMGVEVYHPSAARYGFERLDHMARRLGLLVTGGSDFHQDDDKHGSIGCMIPVWQRLDEDVDALMTALRAPLP